MLMSEMTFTQLIPLDASVAAFVGDTFIITAGHDDPEAL